MFFMTCLSSEAAENGWIRISVSIRSGAGYAAIFATAGGMPARKRASFARHPITTPPMVA
jgi:hypothetical protein